MDAVLVEEILKHQEPRVPKIHVATAANRNDFAELWTEYVVERRAKGGFWRDDRGQIEMALAVFDGVQNAQIPGLSLIVPGVGVNLWGMELPHDTKHGRLLLGHGTYIRRGYRGQGIGGEMARLGLSIIKAMGYDGLLASHDIGNDDGESWLGGLSGTPVQVSHVLRA